MILLCFVRVSLKPSQPKERPGSSEVKSSLAERKKMVAILESPIKDPLRKGQPLNKGHYSGPLSNCIFLRKDNLSTEDKKAGPKVFFMVVRMPYFILQGMRKSSGTSGHH